MKAYFMWQECRPNLTEYQQTSVILNPQKFVIGVEVPDKAEYLVNFIEVNNSILNGQDIPEPIYTPKAIKYCLDKLGEFLTQKVTPDDFKQKPDDEDDEWEEPVKEKTTKDDTWEEDIDTDDKDEKWDEDTENWEEEK